jgi:hypothetical protein
VRIQPLEGLRIIRRYRRSDVVLAFFDKGFSWR